MKIVTKVAAVVWLQSMLQATVEVVLVLVLVVV